MYVHESTVRVNCAPADADQMITIPDGYFYMLGDNADESYNSRYWEKPFASEKDILAFIGQPLIASNFVKTDYWAEEIMYLT